jgi:hypothetical protein
LYVKWLSVRYVPSIVVVVVVVVVVVGVVVVECLQAALYKDEHHSGENEHGSHVCLLESYVIDEIEKGVFNFLNC